MITSTPLDNHIAYAEVISEKSGSGGGMTVRQSQRTRLIQQATENIETLKKQNKDIETRLKKAEKTISSLTKQITQQTAQNNVLIERINQLTNIVQEQYNCAAAGMLFDGNSCVHAVMQPKND